MEKFQVRTDLALEARERFEEDHAEVPGVKIEECYRQETDIRITRVVIGRKMVPGSWENRGASM